ncbi:MAG: glycosyltransferase [Prevotellaceae bacterium]|nr:glycosyltransferase [Prevotellaceae bacterium]
MKDKITLGIPIYNARDLIEQTLLSVLNQTYTNIEYIFVDDKGNSMDVVRRVVSEHPRKSAVRIIDQKQNQGIGAARNAILDNTTGKYLFTMDCDDVIVPNCLELLYNKMQEHPVDFVAASFVQINMDSKQYGGWQYKEDKLVEGINHPVARYRYAQKHEIYVAAWNKLYDVSFLQKYNIRCKVGHFNEDPWFTYQVIINASSCRLIPDCTLFYTTNPKSVSGLSAAKGYSEVIARQYIDIEQLKSAYIRPLAGCSFYRGLLIDIMKMSAYHAYRIGTSSSLTKDLQRELQMIALNPPLTLPLNNYIGGKSLMYHMLRMFFALPTKCKVGLIQIAITLRLQQNIRRWVGFHHKQ